MTQNLSDTEKVVLRLLTSRNKKTIHAYLKKQETPQINKLTLRLKKIEKEQQTKPKMSRRKKILKTRDEINGIKSKNSHEHYSNSLPLPGVGN